MGEYNFTSGERNIKKSSRDVFTRVTVKYNFVQHMSTKYPVKMICRILAGGFVHDDLVISAALCAVLDGENWSVSGSPLVVPAKDPIQMMDKEGF